MIISIKAMIIICTIIFANVFTVNEDTSINEAPLFLEGKEISLIYASDTQLYFSAVNESGFHNLYAISFYENEINMIDYNISQNQRIQYSDGHIYYTKMTGELPRYVFRCFGITDGSLEDVVAVDGFSVKGGQFTLSSAYVANDNYYTSMFHHNSSGNVDHFYIIRIDPSSEVRIISDFMFLPTGFTWHEDNLYFSGVNLSRDGIYVVPDEGGIRRQLRTGPTTLLAISDGKIFFSTGRYADGIIDINYIPLCGCQKINLFSGESANIKVLGRWVYFIDIKDSSKIKRVNIYSGEIQSLTDGRVRDFIISDCGKWIYYQRAYLIGSQIRKLQIPYDELVYSEDLPDTICFGEINILWDDGIMQYGNRVECNNLVLYSIEHYNSNMTQLAVFQPLSVERGWIEVGRYHPQEIIHFELTSDWIILSVGEFQGSAGYFYGGIFRAKRDGSGHESFGLGENNPKFIVADDWIYHNDRDMMGSGEGWIRIRPDGTGKEQLEANIHSIFFFAEDGYMYGTRSTDIMLNEWNSATNLARWQPDSTESIVLFFGDALPSFENSSHMIFRDFIVANDYVIFTVCLWGYRLGDSWRGSVLYTANYKVDKDGNNLMLLSEEFFDLPINVQVSPARAFERSFEYAAEGFDLSIFDNEPGLDNLYHLYDKATAK
jgi:hypothetical protein